jgi:hypothetical protein
MANVPLNLFRNLALPLSATYDPTPVIYTSPTTRASIILNAQAANITDNFQTVTMAVSSKANSARVFLLSGFAIPPNDTANLILGKIVLVDGDRLIGWCSNDNSIHLVVSILETINTEA